MAGAESYYPVQARRNLGGAQQGPPPPPQVAKMVWPEGLRAYVGRAFDSDNDVPGVTPQEMQQRLKLVIQQANITNTLNTIDWAHHPLPQQMIQSERTQQYGHPQLIPPVTDGVSALHLNQPIPQGLPTNITSKKRSSDDLAFDTAPSSIPPWRRQENQPSKPLPETTGRREKRRKFQSEAAELKDTSKFNGDLERRRNRFNNISDKYTSGHRARSPTPPPAATGPIAGTCEILEKPFFRLTSAPKPEQVRPLHVLEKTLVLLKQKWAETENYNYICEQFKSMRQDLTVQHIKNAFTVKVYEAHARFALEKGDLGEYNQCQTQLHVLYKRGIPGKAEEFLAYRILYLLYTESRTELNKAIAGIKESDLAHHEVKHAMEVRKALGSCNYHKFFKLWGEVPNMGGYLVDMFVERERLRYLAQICKAYKPDVLLRFVTDQLCFESDEQAAEFIFKYGAGQLLTGGGQSPDPIKFTTAKALAFFDGVKVIGKN